MNVQWIIYTSTSTNYIIRFHGYDHDGWGSNVALPSSSVMMIIGGDNE